MAPNALQDEHMNRPTRKRKHDDSDGVSRGSVRSDVGQLRSSDDSNSGNVGLLSIAFNILNNIKD